MSELEPTRVILSSEDLINLSKDQLIVKWQKQEVYINFIESQLTATRSASPQETEEKHKQSPVCNPCNPDYARRENFILMRLNSKEQEIQDLIVQIQELKTSQANHNLKSFFMDPALNLLVKQLRKELDNAKASMEETQNELSAWKFTPDSNTGKRLMAKCRLLYQENEELGRMISSGRLAKLEGDLALQRNFSEEMKKSQSELDEFLLELDEDVEGMQSSIYLLQKQLRQTREQLLSVQRENDVLRNVKGSEKLEENCQADERYNGLVDGIIHGSYSSRLENVRNIIESRNLAETDKKLRSINNSPKHSSDVENHQQELEKDTNILATAIDRCTVYSLEKSEGNSQILTTKTEGILRDVSLSVDTDKTEDFEEKQKARNGIGSCSHGDSVSKLTNFNRFVDEDSLYTLPTSSCSNTSLTPTTLQDEKCHTLNDQATVAPNAIENSVLEIVAIEDDFGNSRKRTANQAVVEEESGRFSPPSSSDNVTAKSPNVLDIIGPQSGLKSKRRRPSSDS